ncbi:MAG: hypothetical protein RL235_503, partial [Chlamydiota bacterium]
KVDPVGTCVGVRGTRIKSVIRELNNEKIDVIPYSEDTIQLLQNLLAPTEMRKFKEHDDRMWMVVADEEYPTVIGKKGMNARLIGQMIGKEIEVQKLSEYQKILTIQMVELAESTDPLFDEKIKIEGVSGLITESLAGAGFDTLRKLMQAAPTEVSSKVPGVNYYDLADRIIEQNRKRARNAGP